MDAYSLVILPLLYLQLNFISINEFNTKEVNFTDNFTVAYKVSKNIGANLQQSAQNIVTIQEHQSYLIVKKISY